MTIRVDESVLPFEAAIDVWGAWGQNQILCSYVLYGTKMVVLEDPTPRIKLLSSYMYRPAE